jgi:hypothetical protein
MSGMRSVNRVFLAGTLCLALLTLSVPMLPATARGQTPGQPLPVNPDYAFPNKETLPGVDVNSASLVENANLWSRRTVAFKGEAIGEALVQGSMAWIHVNDDPYMEKSAAAGGALSGYNSGHAIWLPSDLARKIKVFGDYRYQGDIVKVTGVFNAACPEHGGDMDIHATSLTILRSGHSIEHPVSANRGLAAAGLVALAAGLYGVRRRATRRGL